jgi:2-keto-4-pentenoate hydratase
MRHKRLFIFFVLIGWLLVTTCPAFGGSYDATTEKIQAAYMAKKPYPLVSQEITGLTVDQAYEIQSELTRLREEKGEMVMGYKAGLTSAPAQKRFGLDAAVWGTLCKSMLRWPGTLHRKGFAHMFIETEIGFRFGKDITEPVQDSASLKRAVAIVFPAIELPDVAYANMKLIKGTDLIATNVAARKVLIGKAVPVRKMDLNAVTVTLFHNGQEVTSGMGKNALGDQWEALKWVVNDVLARGGKIKDGYIVITGSLGKMVPAKPGTYMADFGDFGTMEFECR